MNDLWQYLSRLFAPRATSPSSTPVATSAIPRVTADQKDMPKTLTRFPADEQVQRPLLFDPSLRHIRRAYRQGDPQFADPAASLRWYTARHTVLDELLKRVAESSCRDHFLLRGSRLLASWFPADARDPGDLDWVIVPPSIQHNHHQAKQLVADIVALIRSHQDIGDIRLLIDQISTDNIWSYEHAPGVRIVVPWQCPDLPPGAVQMDLAFGERLFIDPIEEDIPLFDGTTTRLNVVTPELSLAWKVQWLLCDMEPQGKDLYDAVLLAESVPLPINTLKAALNRADPWWINREPTLKNLEELAVNWPPFLTEHPWIEGAAEDWKARLTRAVTGTLNDG